MRLVALAVIGALGIAACGGGGANSGSPATTPGESLAIEFANCMRAHGVPNFPDPGTPAGNVVNLASPAVKGAASTCQKLEPNNPQPTRPKPSEATIERAFTVARCMRAHRVSDFPDPTVTPPAGNANVIDHAGVLFVLPPNLSPDSPAVQQAARTCGLGPT